MNLTCQILQKVVMSLLWTIILSSVGRGTSFGSTASTRFGIFFIIDFRNIKGHIDVFIVAIQIHTINFSSNFWKCVRT